MIRFRYTDLLLVSRARPDGYVRDVMKSARKIGDDVIMTDDAYWAMRMKYGQRNPPTGRGTALTVAMPDVPSGELVAVDGRPLATSCCGG